MIYIAGPFFNEHEVSVIKSIEDECESRGVEYFSPRLEGGVLKDMAQEERDKKFEEIYYSNVNAIDSADCVLAVIDNFDPGTMFEIGYAIGKKKRIITMTAKEYGLNVMLATPVEVHTTSPKNAIRAYEGDKEIDQIDFKVTT